MVNLGDTVRLLLVLSILGAGSGQTLKFLEQKMGRAAISAHRAGFMSLQEFHQRLERGQ